MTNPLRDELKGKLIIGIDLGTTKSGVAVCERERGSTSDASRRERRRHDSVGRRVGPRYEGLARRQAREGGTRGATVGRCVLGEALHRAAVLRSRRRGWAERTSRTPWPAAATTSCCATCVVRFGQEGAVHHTLDVPEISAKVLARLRRTAANGARTAARGRDACGRDGAGVLRHAAAHGDAARWHRSPGSRWRRSSTSPRPPRSRTATSSFGPEERTILVYDLGGGTFDMSLLDVSRDAHGYQFFTRVIDGNTQLGGDDIDAAIARALEREIERTSGQVVRARRCANAVASSARRRAGEAGAHRRFQRQR